MRRRDLLTLLGGGSALMPLWASAQQPASLPIIGFVNFASPEPFENRVRAFREGLQQVGYIEGQNVTVEYRWAEGHKDRLTGLIDELIKRPVAIIVASGGTSVAVAAERATSAIPIVFTAGTDPVKVGLVASLQHPGGNATGVSLLTTDLIAKRFEVLTELVPAMASVALVVFPGNPVSEISAAETRAAASARGLPFQVLEADSPSKIDLAFARIAEQRSGGAIVSGDAYFESRREQLAALAAHYAIPTVYDTRDYVDVGGLASYGADYAIGYREVGAYCGRILRGAKPADLPVLQLSRIELVVNLKAAKALGLTIPQSILARADEVIE
jgi:ABC-type uncharacterized transport system substrate-binding protein